MRVLRMQRADKSPLLRLKAQESGKSGKHTPLQGGERQQLRDGPPLDQHCC
jgi:hypothetical protein